jgi:glutamyl-tRNA reductase
MPILALGVSYRRAPVELLERLAFSLPDDPKAYRRLLELPAVSEAVVLSTCNRVEIYAEVASYHAGFQELKLFLAESREVGPEEFAEPLYAHYESHAAEHLFSVASGIDSVVLGEPQILAQVRQAYRRAEAEAAVGSVLGRLFRSAIRAGKRARAETAIGASPAGFVEAGTRLAERVLGRLTGRPATVVGAGAIASLAVSYLQDLGMAPIRIVNRSPERAGRLAERVAGEAVPFEGLASAVGASDLVVSSTGATGTVIGANTVQDAVQSAPRAGRPLFFLDLAVPRDVDPAVRDVPDTVVADLDDVKEHIAETEGSSGAQAASVRAVRDIVAEEVLRFEAWRSSARLAPLIHALRERGDRIQAAELARRSPGSWRGGETAPRPDRSVEGALRAGRARRACAVACGRIRPADSGPGTRSLRASGR